MGISHWNWKLKMARFCLVILLAIYASGLVAQPLSEDGLGVALSKEDNRAIDAPSYPGWKAIISYLPIKDSKKCKPSGGVTCINDDECCSKRCRSAFVVKICD